MPPRCNLTPGIGWVRGDQAIDPKILQETERVRIENEELKRRLAQFETGDVTFPDDLAGPDDMVAVTINFKNDDGIPESVDASIPIRDIFMNAYEEVIHEREENLICRTLASLYLRRKPPNTTKWTNAYFTSKDVSKLRYHLEALGLIKAVGFTSVDGSFILWTITEKGRKYMSTLSAIYRQPNPISPA
jgi:hypothetical protein